MGTDRGLLSPAEMGADLTVTPITRTRDDRRTGLPFSAVLGLIVGLALFATSQTSLRDIDVFWHVLAGQALLDGVAPDQVGSTWSFAPDPRSWTSTQWLSEVLFAALHEAFGWAGLAAFRVVTAAVAVAILADDDAARSTAGHRRLPVPAGHRHGRLRLAGPPRAVHSHRGRGARRRPGRRTHRPPGSPVVPAAAGHGALGQPARRLGAASGGAAPDRCRRERWTPGRGCRWCADPCCWLLRPWRPDA